MRSETGSEPIFFLMLERYCNTVFSLNPSSSAISFARNCRNDKTMIFRSCSFKLDVAISLSEACG